MKVERGFGYGAGVPIRFFEVWSLVLELKGELFWSSERGALPLESVCGTVFGGRFWSSERGALRLEGVTV